MTTSHKFKKKDWIVLYKWIIFILSVYFVYANFQSEQEQWRQFASMGEYFRFDSFRVLYIIGAVLLMPINWCIETIKWYYVCKISELPITPKKALYGIFSGIGLAYITPHGLGDYAMRLSIFTRWRDRKKALAGIFLTKISQLYITIFFGSIAFFVYSSFFKTNTYLLNVYVFYLLLVLAAIGFYFLINFEVVWRAFIRMGLSQKIISWVKELSIFTVNNYVVVLGLSWLRYATFTLQYVLVLLFFEVDAWNILVITAIWLVFFVKSVFPSFNFLNDLGIREAAALFFLGQLRIAPHVIVVTSLWVWLINLFIPFLMGIVLILWEKKWA